MMLAFYIGDHKADSLIVRLGWWITRLVQKGPYGRVTHCEAIHYEHIDGSVVIASASVRDKGVRDKRVHLNPKHWMIVNVPQWQVGVSKTLLLDTSGMPYDWRGAVATVLPGSQDSERWFCSEWVATPYLQAAATFGPHHLAAICLSVGKDITLEFFEKRK